VTGPSVPYWTDPKPALVEIGAAQGRTPVGQLTLATGTDEAVGDRAGSAAAQLLVNRFSQVP
jgi:hypothetical protein